MGDDSKYLYYGELPCGCIEVVVVDEPKHKKDVAKTVADMIKRGYAVKRVTMEEYESVRVNVRKCTHKPKKEKKQVEIFETENK